MTTYVLIPREGSSVASAMALGAGTEPRQRGSALRELLSRARMPDGIDKLATSDGTYEAADGTLQGAATDPHDEEVREGSAPRTLEAVGAVVVDDLDESQIATLIDDGIDVVENFEVPLETPVVSTAAAATSTNWHLDDINIAAARAKGLTGQGVRIGILDTGIDVTHPEFASRSVAFMEFDSRGFKISGAPRDAGDHGTHVSGLAAGGTCGVAPDADLSVAAVLTYTNAAGRKVGYFAQILAGANWLLQSNFGTGGAVDEVAVINASLGGPGYRPYLYSVLRLAQVVPATQMICSIGNSGPAMNSDSSPGNYDNSLGVGAYDVAGTIANFSSWGTVAAHGGLAKPDLAAPGVDVRSAKPGGGHQLMSGTSMASPIVTGAAALLLQKTPSLRTNPATLRSLILQNTAPSAPRNRFGWGKLDLTNL